MNYRKIIGEAWYFTQENKKLIVWFAFIPSFLSTVVGVFYILYQFYAFKSSPLFEDWQQSFTFVVVKEVFNLVMEHMDNLVPLFIVAGILVLLYFFLPPLMDGAMIQLIARKKNKQDVRIRDGLRYGFMSFLPLFSFYLITRTYNFFSIASDASFLIRNLGPGVFNLLLPLLILITVLSIILTLIFMFTEYYIVIDDCRVTKAMAKSAVLTVQHWDTTIFISFLMLIISIRIILQVVFVLLVPGIIFMVIFYFAASTIPFFGLIIGAVMAVAALFLASYLGAIVHVFMTSVWAFTFLDLTNEPEIDARGKFIEEKEEITAHIKSSE
jgi:hypothetical protein